MHTHTATTLFVRPAVNLFSRAHTHTHSYYSHYSTVCFLSPWRIRYIRTLSVIVCVRVRRVGSDSEINRYYTWVWFFFPLSFYDSYSETTVIMIIIIIVGACFWDSDLYYILCIRILCVYIVYIVLLQRNILYNRTPGQMAKWILALRPCTTVRYLHIIICRGT